MYNPIEIQNYELIFEPFLFQLKVSGQFEIKSQYQIPAQTLFSKITLPNQEIAEIELIPDKKKKCKSNSWSCQVFKTNTFLKLSGDKYFSREIETQEKVPFHISFELNTNNQQYFLNLNSINNPHNKNYIDFLTQIKLLQIHNTFKFQNTFSIERNKYGKRDYVLNLPISWRIYKEGQQYSYEKLFLNLQKYDEAIHNSIKDWFSIENAENIEIISSEASLLNPSFPETQLGPLNTRYTNKSIFFFLPEDNYRIDKGFLKSKIFLKLRNNSFALKIRNSFSYRNLNSSIKKVRVIRKDIDSKSLDLSKWIEI